MELLDRQTAAYVLDRMVAESARYGRRLSVVRLRMPAEDVPEATERLRFALRDADVLVRWTDEDVLALLPETDLTGAETTAERLRDAIRDLPVHAGTAQWEGETGDVLLRRAGWAAVRP
jgi:diguanylate cyclase with GGDEF domain